MSANRAQPRRRPKYVHKYRVIQFPTQSPAVAEMSERFPTARPGCHCRGQPEDPVCYTGHEGSVTLSSVCFADCIGMTPEDYTDGACDTPQADAQAEPRVDAQAEPRADEDFETSGSGNAMGGGTVGGAPSLLPPPVPTLPPFVPTMPPPGLAEKPVREFRIQSVRDLVFEPVPAFYVPGDQYLERGGYAGGHVGHTRPTTDGASWEALDQPWVRYVDETFVPLAIPGVFGESADTVTAFRDTIQ